MQTTEKEEIREMVRQVIREEMLTFALNLMPYVSDEEQRDIEASFRVKDEDFANGMAWLGR